MVCAPFPKPIQFSPIRNSKCIYAHTHSMHSHIHTHESSTFYGKHKCTIDTTSLPTENHRISLVFRLIFYALYITYVRAYRMPLSVWPIIIFCIRQFLQLKSENFHTVNCICGNRMCYYNLLYTVGAEHIVYTITDAHVCQCMHLHTHPIGSVQNFID